MVDIGRCPARLSDGHLKHRLGDIVLCRVVKLASDNISLRYSLLYIIPSKSASKIYTFSLGSASKRMKEKIFRFNYFCNEYILLNISFYKK